MGFPFLAVMDAGGKLLVGQKTDPLEHGDHHDPKKVKEFLARWVVEPKDAQVVLQVVSRPLSRAASEDNFRSIGSRYVCATVESRRAAWDGDALPHRGRAFGLPQFDNRSVQPHGGTWTWVPLQKGWWPTRSRCSIRPMVLRNS